MPRGAGRVTVPACSRSALTCRELGVEDPVEFDLDERELDELEAGGTRVAEGRGWRDDLAFFFRTLV